MTAYPSAPEDESRLLSQIRALVACESPSHDASALEACAQVLIRHLTEAGAHVERVGAHVENEAPGLQTRGLKTRGSIAGSIDTVDHVVATWPGGGPRVLLLGHFDTVWPRGQIERQPLLERDGRLFGPGVFDMKAGLSIAINAVRTMTSRLSPAARPAVTFLATCDEETGSATSRGLIEQLARGSAAVLVFEPALSGTGGVKTSRKGVGEFEITASGIAAHAGVDPSAGASAIHELARQIIAVQALGDPARGLTVNVGIVSGGTRSNVVAEQARAVVDVRISALADAPRIEAALRGLRAFDSRVTLSVTGGVNRPPMERGPGVARLFAMARDIAREQGWALTEGGTGGGSDGNFSAALGVPTLDGLGAVGDGAHALHEHVVIKDLAPRVALAAGLLARLGDNKQV